MKFKLDENLDWHLASLLQKAGYDASTAQHQNLSGADDAALFRACVREKKILVTLDLDFADVLKYPPSDSSGIIVLRPPKFIFPLIKRLLEQLIIHLNHESPQQVLWIVEEGRLRIHQEE